MIDIKITGNSIPEIADKLLAMGRALQAGYEEMRVQVEKEADAIIEKSKATATAKRSRKKAEPAAETASEPDAVEPDAVEPDAAEPETDAEEVPALETVTAAVLSAVERVGRDKVVAILTQFGVARASEVPAEKRAELLAMVKDA